MDPSPPPKERLTAGTPPTKVSSLPTPQKHRRGGGMARKQVLVPVERIERAILLIRAQKVMLDADLAELYGVEPRVLIQAVKRNIDRFPQDFMFQLTKREFSDLRSQIVMSSWGGRRYPPYAFTEHGWRCSPAYCGASGPSGLTSRS